MPAFTKFNRKTGRYEPIEGTEGFIEVARLDRGDLGDWDELGVYYSPSRRRYFWLHDLGNSGNAYGEEISGLDAFQNGSREDALRAASEFAAVRTHAAYGYGTVTQEERQRFLTAIRAFEERDEKEAG